MDETMDVNVSVVIPVYDAAPYLRECLAGLAECEVICVDDGSTDGSGALLERIKSEGGFRQFVVLHQANGGPSSARNRALEAVTGEYVMFLDADDWLEPHSIARLKLLVARYGRPDVIQFERHGEAPVLKRERFICRPHDLRRYVGDVCRVDRLGLVTGKLYRRDILDGLSFDPAVVGEDTLYAVQAVKRAKRVVLSPLPLYNYRVVPQSYSHRPFPRILPMAERMLELLRKEVGDGPAYCAHAVGKFQWCVAASGVSRRELAARPLFAEALRKTRMCRAAGWARTFACRVCRKAGRVIFG